MKMPNSNPVTIACPRCGSDVGEVKVWLEVDYRLTHDGKKNKGMVDIDVKVATDDSLPRSFSTSNEIIEHVCSDIELVGGVIKAQTEARRTTALDLR